jgi:hypothetical protein
MHWKPVLCFFQPTTVNSPKLEEGVSGWSLWMEGSAEQRREVEAAQ